MKPRRWSAGVVIADRYQLEAPIGAGGMGEVWRAHHTRLRSPVAVKLIHEDDSRGEDWGERFLREAQACAALRGPNVVEVLDVGVEGHTPYLAMELLVGETLSARLERGALGPAATAKVLSQVVRAIARAHKHGIVHRDLKPANVFLVKDEETDEEMVKVLDFGIAKLLEGTRLAAQTLTRTGAILGSGSYMSPEQARGTRDIDHRSDLFSLAVLAFQCATGKLPIVAASFADLVVALNTEPMPVPSQVSPGLPAAFDLWFAKATRRSPDARFQSATELGAELAAALGR
ncbi:MAG: serine/threonine protein kinase [Polyangiaceae bacterium]|nr:serine/threonine protein kinase [Polyangiaceae bacterium]